MVSKNKDVMLIGGNDIPQFEGTPPKWIEELWHNVRDQEGNILVDYSCILLREREKEIAPYYVFGCNLYILSHCKCFVRAKTSEPVFLPIISEMKYMFFYDLVNIDKESRLEGR